MDLSGKGIGDLKHFFRKVNLHLFSDHGTDVQGFGILTALHGIMLKKLTVLVAATPCFFTFLLISVPEEHKRHVLSGGKLSVHPLIIGIFSVRIPAIQALFKK